MATRQRRGESADSSTVHLTRIYTRTGDDGTTGLGDMSRAPKTGVRVAAYGDVDEANSSIGVAIALGALPADVVSLLMGVQNDLFDVGADLCTPIVPEPQWVTLRVDDSYVQRLERACDEHNADLPKLDSFLLPGGSPAATALHVARSAPRPTEPSTCALLEAGRVS